MFSQREMSVVESLSEIQTIAEAGLSTQRRVLACGGRHFVICIR